MKKQPTRTEQIQRVRRAEQSRGSTAHSSRKPTLDEYDRWTVFQKPKHREFTTN